MAGKHVLLVDDETSVRDLVKALIIHLGHSCQAVGSGEEALTVFQAADFQLVITDFKMPKMNGETLAQEIKRLRPDMPVLMITGNQPLTLSRAVDQVLLKPFSSNQLRDAIASLSAPS